MDLKRIDNLWHFFATQNQLFLKREVQSQVSYFLKKNNIQLIHQFNPKFLGQSRLSIQQAGFEMAVEFYTSGQKKFGLKSTALRVHQRIFFPKEIMKLNSLFTVYVERDRFKNLKVSLEPFLPTKIKDILIPVNTISQTLWDFKFFSEVIKN